MNVMSQQQENFNNVVITALSQILAKQDVILAMVTQQLAAGNQEKQEALLSEVMKTYSKSLHDYAEKFTEAYLRDDEIPES
jgi:uncharacterized protein with gpF-like domain